MRYSPHGSTELVSWAAAAKAGGSTPPHPVPGEPRRYNVDGWCMVDFGDGREPVLVSGIWFSALPDDVREVALKELGLPVSMGLCFIGDGGRAQSVTDIRISEVWDGWCNLEVALDGDRSSLLNVHSMHLAEMNGDTGNDSDIKLPLDFILFDVEASGTDPSRDQICEIAAVKVADGVAVGEFQTLVYMDLPMPRGAEAVNHISDDMLSGAPHATEALRSFLDFIGDDAVLVGHNVETYDIPFIERVAGDCGLKFAYAYSIDTLSLARTAWPELPNHRLDTLRDALSLSHDHAHRALKDCYDNIGVYMALREGSKLDKTTLEKIGAHSRKRARKRTAWTRIKAKDVTTDVTDFDSAHPLYLKNVVVSGDIEGWTYDAALQFVKDHGGQPQDNVTQKTNILVVGENPGRTKVNKAESLIKEKGLPIEIIDAATFIEYTKWNGAL